MPYHESGYPISDEAWAHSLAIFDVPAATLWAILRVETNGFGFLPSRRPVIRYERHVFHRLTEGKFDLEYPDISNPVPGGYAGGAAEYPRLDAASALDPEAAAQSTSWGIGRADGISTGPTPAIRVLWAWPKEWRATKMNNSSRWCDSWATSRSTTA